MGNKRNQEMERGKMEQIEMTMRVEQVTEQFLQQVNEQQAE